jgi:DtxR family Mn-dependent transcriptional regulator
MVEFGDLSESSQGYLEAILELETAHKVARAKEIADRLGVQRASVTGALKSLEEKGLIDYRPYSYITLTPAGRKIAEEVARRHRVIKEFLLNVLRVAAPVAEATACRLEHAIDPLTLERLACFTEFLRAEADAGSRWPDAFARFQKRARRAAAPHAASRRKA